MVELTAHAGDGFVMETGEGNVYFDVEASGDGICVRVQTPKAVKIWRDDLYLRFIDVVESA